MRKFQGATEDDDDRNIDNSKDDEESSTDEDNTLETINEDTEDSKGPFQDVRKFQEADEDDDGGEIEDNEVIETNEETFHDYSNEEDGTANIQNFQETKEPEETFQNTISSLHAVGDNNKFLGFKVNLPVIQDLRDFQNLLGFEDDGDVDDSVNSQGFQDSQDYQDSPGGQS